MKTKKMQREVNGRKKHGNDLLQAMEETLALKSRIATLEESLRFSREERENLEFKLHHLTHNSRQAEARITGLATHCHQLEAVLLASSRLLIAFTRKEAVLAIQDIVANVIGSEQMALVALTVKDSDPEIIARCGVTEEQCLHVATEEGVAARVWRSGVAVFPRSACSGIAACVPLRANGRVVAVLTIFSLLPQKLRLEPLDMAVMKFLEDYAGTLLLVRHKPTAEEQK